MNATIGTVLIIVYFIILVRFFPGGRRTLDVFKLKPVLLPHWGKLIGIGWLIFVFIHSILDKNFNPLTNSFLLSGIYFGLLIIAFSKEKREDEFATQIRLKAFYITMISVFFLVGVFSALILLYPESFFEKSFVFFMMMFNAILIVYLSYFYYTKYGSKK